MGRDKALLPVAGEPVVVRLARRLLQVTDRVVLVGRNRHPYRFLGLPFLSDWEPGCGPLPAIVQVLETEGPAILLGCDLPCLPAAFLALLRHHGARYDTVAPFVEGRWHPLAAAYSPAALPLLREIRQEGGRLQEVLNRSAGLALREAELAPVGGPDILYNMNTPTAHAWVVAKGCGPQEGSQG